MLQALPSELKVILVLRPPCHVTQGHYRETNRHNYSRAALLLQHCGPRIAPRVARSRSALSTTQHCCCIPKG